jgi:transcriptional regulator with XRE-family HTH domain
MAKTNRSTPIRKLRREVGARLHATRANRGMTLRRLSECTGIPAHRLDYYEIGGHDVSLGELERIAKALGTSAVDLMMR